MGDYAGDIQPTEAWRLLAADPEAVLIDVRSDAEWTFVGLCDLSSLGKEPLLVAWQIFPGMVPNEAFTDEVAAVVGVEQPALFLCRSGVRSRAAAAAMTARGFTHCYNIAGGFEGDPDDHHHRGGVNGWKAGGLPWIQG